MKKAVFMGLVFSVITAGVYANENEGIFTYKVGQFDVYMIVESERDGNTGILIGADEAVLNRYIPASGFRHTANAFLVKEPGQNILIDTGTGAGGFVLGKIKNLGVQPEDINVVLITHLHGDHFGSLQADGKAVFPNAKIYLSVREHEHFTKTSINQAAVNALAPYSSQIVTFEPAEWSGRLKEILPGITPIAAYGHTPGHTVYQIESEGQKLLIIGDLLHVALVQFPVPQISATFDMDPSLSAQVRTRILDYAVRNRIPVGGMHIVYPGIGFVEVQGSGFRFLPVR